MLSLLCPKIQFSRRGTCGSSATIASFAETLLSQWTSIGY